MGEGVASASVEQRRKSNVAHASQSKPCGVSSTSVEERLYTVRCTRVVLGLCTVHCTTAR